MTTDTQQRLKEIKQSFRLMMDGVTAQSMRNKGLDYHLNWGASQAMLRDKADEIGKDHDLAIALWKEDVRECKILATMVMPADTMEEDLVEPTNGLLPTNPSDSCAASMSFRACL